MKTSKLFSNKMLAVYCAVLVALIVVLIITSKDYQFSHKTNISQSELNEIVKDGSVEKLLLVKNVDDGNEFIEVWLIDSLKSRYIELYPKLADDNSLDFYLKVLSIDSFIENASKNELFEKIEVKYVERHNYVSQIIGLLTLLLFGLIVFIILRIIYRKAKHTVAAQYLIRNKPKIALIISGILFVFLLFSSKSYGEFVILKPEHLLEPQNYYRFLLYITYVESFSQWLLNAFFIVLFGFVIERFIKTIDVIKLVTISYVFGGVLYLVIALLCGESYSVVSSGIIGKTFLYVTVIISVIIWKKLNVFEKTVSVIGYLLLLWNIIDFILVLSYYSNKFPFDKVIFESVFMAYLIGFIFINRTFKKVKSN